MDWSLGNYEQVATQLLPAARVAIELGAPRPGEHVLDIGCGTGNAALLAAERGAHVIGVDPAQRLLEIASNQAAERDLGARFTAGTAEALPIPDASADLIVSVFGAIFASNSEAAIAEMARVAGRNGRIVLCAWIPEGALFDGMRLRRQAVSRATGELAPAPRLAWHEKRALDDAFSPMGFRVKLQVQQLTFNAPSAAQFIDAELHNHPLWIAARKLLEPRGEMEALRDRVEEIYLRANEDANAFGLTSPYVVASFTRA